MAYLSEKNSLGPRDPKRISRAAYGDSRSVQSFAIIKNTALNTGILLWAFFTLELEVDYPSD